MGIYTDLKRTKVIILAFILIFTSLITSLDAVPAHAEEQHYAGIDGNLKKQPVNSFNLEYRNNVELDKDEDKIYITFPEGMLVKQALENSRYAVSIYWEGLSHEVRPSLIQVEGVHNGKQTLVLSDFTLDIPVNNLNLNINQEEHSPTLINPEEGIHRAEVYTSKNTEKKPYSFEVKTEALTIEQQSFVSAGKETTLKVRNINSSLDIVDFDGEVIVTANYQTFDNNASSDEKTVVMVNGEGEVTLPSPLNLKSVSIHAYKAEEPLISGHFHKGFHTNQPNVFIKATDHNGNLLENEMMYFRNVTNDRMFGNGMESGFFTNYLEDGEYEILGINQGAGMAEPIKVANGKATVGGQVLTPDTPYNYQLRAPNFKITFKNEDGKLYKGGSVFVNKRVPGRSYSSNFTINKNGEIISYLPEGEYNLSGITDQYGISIAKSINFKITKDHSEANKLELTVQSEPSNVFNEEVKINDKIVNTGTVTIVSNDINNYHYYNISIQAFENGKRGFKLPLTTGDYKIQSVYDFATDHEYVINQPFTVQSERTNVEVNTSTNVNGTIFDLNGQPAMFSHANIRDSKGSSFHVSTSSSGRFFIHLQDGTYTIETVSINGTERIINRSFKVENGQMAGTLEIRPVESNFNGSIYKNKSKQEKVENGYITLRQQQSGDEMPLHLSLKVLNGEFQAFLPDGVYEVIDVMNDRWEWESFEDNSFEMRDGKLLVSNQEKKSLDVFLTEANFYGNLFQDSAGEQPVEYRGFSVIEDKEHTENSVPNHYWIRTGDNGEFKQYLPAGDYFIDGISTDDSWMQLKMKFSINETGKIVIAGVVQEIGWQVTPPAPNMTGKLLNENGNPISHGGFSLRENKDWSENPEHVWISTDQQGNYSYNLPMNNEGYIVEGIWDGEKFLNLDNIGSNSAFEFKITNDNPTITRDVRLPAKTVAGKIIGNEDENIIYHGISIKKKVDEYSYDYYWISSDENGEFAGIVPDGTYEVDGVGTYQGWISLANQGETISLPNLNVELQVKPNVKGSVKKDGQLITNGSLKIRPNELDPSKEPWEQEIYIQVQDGLFSAILDDTKTYTILGIHQESGYTQLNQTLAVSKDIEIIVPAYNVSGTIEGLNAGDLNHAWLHIVPLENGVPNWNNAVWAKVKADGTYSTYLKEGDYLLSGISTEAKWISLDQQKTITSGNNTVDLDLNTVSNLEGIVKNAAGTVLPGAWIGYTIGEDSTIKWVQADETGKFTFPYTDGETYTVTDVNDAQNNDWDDNLSISLTEQGINQVTTDFE